MGTSGERVRILQENEEEVKEGGGEEEGDGEDEVDYIS